MPSSSPLSMLGEIAKHPWVLNLVLMLPFLDLVSDYVQLITAEGWDTLFLAGAIFFALSQLWRLYVDSWAMDGWWVGGVVVVVYRLFKLLLSPLDVLWGLGAAQAQHGRCCSSALVEFEILDDRHLFGHEQAYFRQLPPWAKYYQAFMSLSAGARWYTNALENGMPPPASVKPVLYWRGALVEEVVENIGGFLMAVSVLFQNRGDNQETRSTISTAQTIAVISLLFTLCSAVYETGYLQRKVKMHNDNDEENQNDGAAEAGENEGAAEPPTNVPRRDEDEEQSTNNSNKTNERSFASPLSKHGCFRLAKIVCNIMTLAVVVGLGALSIYTIYDPVTPSPTAFPTVSSMPTSSPSLVPTTAPSRPPTTQPTATEWRQLGSDLNGEAANDESGWSVALSADGYTLAIGARENDGNGDGAGHVRVYQYDGASLRWEQQGRDLDGEAAGDNAGQSVALSADGLTVAVGARYNDGNGNNAGQVRVFVYNLSTREWDQLGQDLDGEARLNLFGYALDLSWNGRVVAVGGRQNDNTGGVDAGHVRVFVYDSQDTLLWIQRGQDLDGEAEGDHFGISVALSSDGMIVAVGAFDNNDNGSESGHVRIFSFQESPSQWAQLGQTIAGEEMGDQSGWAVALSADGETVAIGAILHDGGVDGERVDSGQVRVWTLDSSSMLWLQLGPDIVGEDEGDQFGHNLALSSDGRTLAVGARFHDDGFGRSDVGHIRVFDFNNATTLWEKAGRDLNGEAQGDQFGGSFGHQAVALSADGRIVAGGAPGNNAKGFIDTGHVRVFERF